jgi:N-acetylglucosamine-6-phosphate deacetylase
MSAAAGMAAILDVRLAEEVSGGPRPGEPAAALLEDGRVAAAAPMSRRLPEPFRRAAAEIDGGGGWLLPGWVDIQVNDIEWLAGGLRSPEAHCERVREVARYQAARGATGFILATLAAPEEEIIAYLEGMALALREARERDPGSPPGDNDSLGAFLGALVEGTFMNPAYHGAHNPAHVRPPEIPLLDRFLDTGAVRLVNIAPEAAPGAIDAIAHAARRGAVVGVGHAKPSARRVREAAAAGLRYVIHLGNGPTGSSLKSFEDGGLMEEALRNDNLIASLIIDGVHLDPRLVRDIIARKGIERVIAVSDAGFAAGNPAGEFEVFGIRGRMAPGGYLEVVTPSDRPPPNPLSSDCAPLFGSAADMRRIFETTLNLLTREMEGIYHRRHPALDPAEALRQASRLCSANPARLRGDPGDFRVELERVWVEGTNIY